MQTINSLDLYAIVREINTLKESRVEKIYQPRKDILLITLYNKNAGKQLIRIISGKTIYLTKFKKDYTNFPPHFCMFLRKYLKNSVLKAVLQRKNDRIVELKFSTKTGEKKLIIELFGVGNFILTDDKYQIIAVNQVQKIKDRILMVHKTYKPPQIEMSALAVNSLVFKKVLKISEENSVIKTLAKDLRLGKKYAEEIIKRSSVQKDTPPKTLNSSQIEQIYQSLDEVIRFIKFKSYTPIMVFEDEKVTNFAPFPLQIFEGFKTQKANNFNHSLEEYYTFNLEEEYQEETSKLVEAKKDKLLDRLEKQEEKVSELSTESKEYRNVGAEILSNLGILEQIQTTIKTALDKGIHVDEINQRIKKDKENNLPQAMIIDHVDTITKKVKINNPPFLMDLNQNIGRQASQYYSGAKQKETKVESAQQHIGQTKDLINDFQEQTAVESIFKQRISDEPIIKNWFDKFKNFRTSQNHLFICGRDAVQNEEIIKRYMKDSDLIFHADLVGSPFGLLRLDKNEQATEEELNECATFTVSNSRAFREGLQNSSVYWVKPEQVQKDTSLPKGSFMIYGKRNYYRNIELRMALSVQNGKLVNGPESLIKKSAKKYFIIQPGHLSAKEAFEKISKGLNLTMTLDQVVLLLPTGTYYIEEKISDEYQNQPQSDFETMIEESQSGLENFSDQKKEDKTEQTIKKQEEYSGFSQITEEKEKVEEKEDEAKEDLSGDQDFYVEEEFNDYNF